MQKDDENTNEEYKKLVEKNMKLLSKELKQRNKTGIIKPLTGYEIIKFNN